MANEVKLKLAIEGGQVVSATIDGVTHSLTQVTPAAKSAKDEAQSALSGIEKSAKGAEAAMRNVPAQIDGVSSRLAKITPAAHAAQVKSQAALGSMEMSAKATAAAMRGVPAQFTDIITSLQGGQAPLTVLLQQGGQLKDMFGGAGNAAKALSSYVIGLINPYTLAATAAAAVGAIYYKVSGQTDEYTKAIALSGNAAVLTVGKLKDMELQVAASSGALVGTGAAVLAQFARLGDVGSQHMADFSSTAVQMERVAGVAVEDTVKLFAKLADAPVKASQELNKTTNFLTADLYLQIKALNDQGDKAGASALAMDAFNAAQKRALADIQGKAGIFERAWDAVRASVVSTGNAVAGLFRADSISEKISKLKDQIADVKKNAAYDPMSARAELPGLQARLVTLEQIASSEQRYAAYQQRTNDKTQAQIKLEELHEQSLGKSEQRARKLAEAAAAFAGVDQTPENIAKYAATVSDIADKYKDAAVAKTAAKSAADSYLESLDKQLWKEQQLSAVQTLGMQINMGMLGKLSQAKQDQLVLAAIAVDIAKEQADAEKALKKAQSEAATTLAKGQEAATKSRLDDLASITKATATLQEQIRVQQDNNASIGLSAEAIAQLTAQRELDKAATLEAMAIKELDRNLDYQKYDAVMAEVKAMRELATEKARGGILKTADESAQALKKANQSAAEASGKFWEDALMRAFESGKGFFDSLWSTIKNTLATQVIKVLIAPVTSGLSLGAAASQDGTGAASMLGTASNLSSLFDKLNNGIGNSISTGFNSFAQTAIGQKLGLWTAGNNPSAAGLTSLGGNISGALQMGGNAVAGYGIYNALSGGKSINSFLDKVGTVASLFGPVYGAVGGLLNAAFGSGPLQMTGQGTRGTFGAGGSFSGVNYANYHRDGGWFTSDTNTTDISTMDAKTKAAWESTFAGLKTQLSSMATSVGLSTDKIAEYTKYIDVAAGTTQEQLTAIFTNMADEMASATSSTLTALAKTDESASATLERLSSSLASVNQYMGLLDKTLLSASLTSADAASKLVDLFGGIDQFAAGTKNYYDLFYSDAERLAKTSEAVAKSLALVGQAMPASKDAYRAVVDGLDLASEAGRNSYSVMIGLAPEFDKVATAAKVATDKITQGFTDTLAGIQKGLTDLLASIATERSNVASAVANINPQTKTLGQLQEDVAAVYVGKPGTSGLEAAAAAQTAAAQDMAAKQSVFDAKKATLTMWQDTQSQVNARLEDAKNAAAKQISDYQAMSDSLRGPIAAAREVSAAGAYAYNSTSNRFSGFAQTHSDAGGYYDYMRITAATRTALDGANTALAASEQTIASITTEAAAYAEAVQLASNATASAADALAASAIAKSAADAAAQKALDDYAAAEQAYIKDASKAVTALSKLREETVAYYEAQKALSQSMMASAANLRQAADSVRLSQLDPVQTLAQQQAAFAQNYSMALATSGADKAAYADKLTAALPALSEAIKATSTTRDWAMATAKLAAQSNTVASQLDAAAAINYEADSLALLDSIDQQLAVMQSDAAIISAAVQAGADQTSAGLHAVVAALTGSPIPAFATGGQHAGGLRIVGENGPELELTGPSRIFNADQTRSILQGGGTQNNDALLAEIRALRAEVAELRKSNSQENTAIASHAALTADATRRMFSQGVMVYTDPAEPLQVAA